MTSENSKKSPILARFWPGIWTNVNLLTGYQGMSKITLDWSSKVPKHSLVIGLSWRTLGGTPSWHFLTKMSTFELAIGWVLWHVVTFNVTFLQLCGTINRPQKWPFLDDFLEISWNSWICQAESLGWNWTILDVHGTPKNGHFWGSNLTLSMAVGSSTWNFTKITKKSRFLRKFSGNVDFKLWIWSISNA